MNFQRKDNAAAARCLLALAALLVSWPSPASATDPSPPAGKDPGATKPLDGAEVICLRLDAVPLIRKINEADDDVSAKRTALETALTKFEADCRAYLANPQQQGPLKDAISQDTATLPGLSHAFTAAADPLMALELKAWKAMGRLGEGDCQKRLGSERTALERQKAQFAQRANLACNDRQSRAASLKSLGDEAVQQAILDPKAHRADSEALLEQAKAYGATLRPPVDPTGGNSRDFVCGESCVALLRSQAAAEQYGPNSWQAQAAAQSAQSTKRGIYGYRK